MASCIVFIRNKFIREITFAFIQKVDLRTSGRFYLSSLFQQFIRYRER
jgi:hypothetical protein